MSIIKNLPKILLLAAILLIYPQISRGQENIPPLNVPGALPLPYWSDVQAAKNDREELTQFEHKLTESRVKIEDEIAQLNELVEHLNLSNVQLLHQRERYARQLQSLVEENSVLIEQTKEFDPVLEELVAGNRARIQDLELAMSEAAQRIEANRQLIKSHWASIQRHEDQLVQNEELLDACQLMLARQGD